MYDEPDGPALTGPELHTRRALIRGAIMAATQLLGTAAFGPRLRLCSLGILYAGVHPIGPVVRPEEWAVEMNDLVQRAVVSKTRTAMSYPGGNAVVEHYSLLLGMAADDEILACRRLEDAAGIRYIGILTGSDLPHF